jgi:hypothetical protein
VAADRIEILNDRFGAQTVEQLLGGRGRGGTGEEHGDGIAERSPNRWRRSCFEGTPPDACGFSTATVGPGPSTLVLDFRTSAGSANA